MQLLFDFLPVLAFFIAYKIGGIYVATGAIIVAMLIQASVQWFTQRKLSPMMIVSTVLVLVFGGITLLLHDDTFIKWKPTVLNWLFAAAFLVSQFVGSQTMVERLMGSQIQLESSLWKRLNLMWITFFIIMGAANIYAFKNFSQATWVNFKVFGMLGLTIVFVLIQGVWLASKMPEEPAAPVTDPEQRN